MNRVPAIHSSREGRAPRPCRMAGANPFTTALLLGFALILTTPSLGEAVETLGAGTPASPHATDSPATASLRSQDTTSDDPRLQQLDPTIRAEIGRWIETARAESLPSEPILLRALEGTTKGASPGHVVHVVSLLLERLRLSRRLLGPARSPDELVAAAGCLAAGVDSTALRELGGIRPEGALMVPMIVLTDLVGRGAPVESATCVTAEMLSAGLADRQFLELRAAVQQDLQSGVRPADALLSRFRALPRGEGAPSRLGAGTHDPRRTSPPESSPIAPTTRSGR